MWRNHYLIVASTYPLWQCLVLFFNSLFQPKYRSMTKENQDCCTYLLRNLLKDTFLVLRWVFGIASLVGYTVCLQQELLFLMNSILLFRGRVWVREAFQNFFFNPQMPNCIFNEDRFKRRQNISFYSSIGGAVASWQRQRKKGRNKRKVLLPLFSGKESVRFFGSVESYSWDLFQTE